LQPGEGDDELERRKDDYYEINIMQMDTDEYRCGICGKVFHLLNNYDS
jgi:hypothetical protein